MTQRQSGGGQHRNGHDERQRRRYASPGEWMARLVAGDRGNADRWAGENGILFQRETRETLAHHEEQLKYIEGRAREAIVREFQRQDQRIDKIAEALDSL